MCLKTFLFCLYISAELRASAAKTEQGSVLLCQLGGRGHRGCISSVCACNLTWSTCCASCCLSMVCISTLAGGSVCDSYVFTQQATRLMSPWYWVRWRHGWWWESSIFQTLTMWIMYYFNSRIRHFTNTNNLNVYYQHFQLKQTLFMTRTDQLVCVAQVTFSWIIQKCNYQRRAYVLQDYVFYCTAKSNHWRILE